PARAGGTEAVAVGVIRVGGDGGAVLLHPGQAAVSVVGVAVGGRRPADRLYLLRDPAQGVERVPGIIQGPPALAGAVAGGLAEAVVAHGVAHTAERGAGDQAGLGVAGQRQVPGPGEQAVGVTLEGDRRAAVDAQRGGTEVAVGGAADAAGDGAGPTR